MKKCRLFGSCLIMSLLFSGGLTQAQGVVANSAKCDVELLSMYEADFDKVLAQQAEQGTSVSAQTTKDLKIMARKYVDMNIACYDQIYGSANSATPQLIDHGGIRELSENSGSGFGEFSTFGTKWGANSPFGGGQDRTGPQTSGGVVTYSFIGNGVSHAAEGVDNNLAIRSLPGFSSCFTTEINRAFAAWSAVADIDFRLVSDNGRPTNAAGANGDIRIGAHTFDGAGGVLAHAFFPPPNFGSVAGDMHLDRAENWACDASQGFDIGIIVGHEIGHSIGLNHEEFGEDALMNPFYNPDVPTLLSDDRLGVVAIYGVRDEEPPVAPATTGVVVNFLDDLPLIVEFERLADECVRDLGDNPQTLFESSWQVECGSISRSQSFARFYPLRLTSQRTIEINLSSSVDTFLYLLGSNDQILQLDDDGGAGLNSRIQATLPAGNYLIEATTFSSARLGDFLLDVR